MSEPIETFKRYFYSYLLPVSRTIGLAVLDPNFEVTAWTKLWFSLNASFLLGVLYTLYAYDTETKWKTLAFLGFTIIGLVQFVVFSMSSAEIRENVNFLQSIFESNRLKNTINYKTLKRWSTIAMIIFQLGTFLVVSTGIMFILICGFKYLVLGTPEPIMQTFLPGVDEQTRTGYWILFAYHLFIVILATAGTHNCDLTLVMLVLHTCMIAEVFQNMFTQLNEALQRPENKIGANEKRFFLRNILQMHQEICRYITSISDIYSITFFCQIYTVAFTLCLLLFCILTINWVNLYFLFLIMASKLFCYCFLGTVVEVTTDKIYESIISCNWYLLPTNQQKLIMVMMQRSQEPNILMAGTIPLNLDTFVNVSKSVYSVGMLLIESLQ